MKQYPSIALLLAGLFVLVGCGRNEGTTKHSAKKTKAPQKITRLESPKRNTTYKVGDEIRVEVRVPDSLTVDSVVYYFNGIPAATMTGNEPYALPTRESKPGFSGVRAKIYFNDTLSETHSRQVELLSDIVPEQYGYRIVNTYPHDIGAYTQGLIYYDGWLYEGTGNKNQSTIRKVRLQTGEVIQSRNNASEIFGEGITIFDGKIYQLTYHAQICYVYDLNTFKEINKFYFQNKEGWGLTSSADELIMSDGSHMLYFIDPDMFTVIRQIEVYNDEGPVSDLNELEYINGKIFANRYYTDEIVVIDPETGKEEARVDMKGLLSAQDRKPSTNVLNGIAYDAGNDRLFVTGKYWPKLFEIELVK